MAFLFKSKHKSPQELIKNTKEIMSKLDDKKNLETLAQNLQSIKVVLVGDAENEPVPELVAQLAQEVYNSDILPSFVTSLEKLEFEQRKDVGHIFSNLLRRQIGTRQPTVEYLCTREGVIVDLIKGYERADIALNCGSIARDCFKYEPLAKIAFAHDAIFTLYEYLELNTFDISSDAFSTFKDLLTRHKTIASEFMLNNYTKFFDKYTPLLSSTNYVLKRQSIKLLGEILLDRSNFKVMTTYIGNPENLKMVMNLLRDKSKNVQFEAFHVFKVFVANPNKAQPIKDILIRNKERLLPFLSSFQDDKQEDEQFVEEKGILMKIIQEL